MLLFVKQLNSCEIFKKSTWTVTEQCDKQTGKTDLASICITTSIRGPRPNPEIAKNKHYKKFNIMYLDNQAKSTIIILK